MKKPSLFQRALFSAMQFGEKRGMWQYGQSSDAALARSGFWSMGTTGSTGLTVTEETALRHSVFWACVNNISTDVGTLPLNLYKAEENGAKTVLRRHKLHQLLHYAPNPEMTAATFRGVLTSHALTWGTGYAEVVRDGAGAVRELWPITPDRVTVRRQGEKQLYYEVTRSNGTPDRLTPSQMFVLPGSSYDGTCGYNIVSLARESIGLGLAAERFGGTFFGNGSTFGGVFEHPGRMSEQALKNFRESVNTKHQGVDRAHLFFVAEEGMKYHKLGIDPDAAQFLETRQFQIEEVCRWFRMPPHKVQHLIRTSYNSAEQLALEYSTDTLQPWCVRWEQEIWRQLIAPSERLIQFVKHNMDGKLRGDYASRHTAYGQGIQHGYLSPNDVREYEDLNPIKGGDVYAFPVNMVPSDRIDEVIDKQVEPDPEPVAPVVPAEKKEDGESERMVAAIHAALLDVEAKIAEHATRAATADARFEDAQATQAELAATLAEHQAAAQQAREEAARLQALLDLATQHAEREAAEKEAERVALAEQVEAAKVAGIDAETRASQLAADLDAEKARAVQLNADAQIMAETSAAAHDMIAQLRTLLAESDVKIDSAQTSVEAAEQARHEAEQQLAAVREALATLQVEAERLAQEREAAKVEAQTAAEKAEADHQARQAAVEALQLATAEAESAKQHLADETARLEQEQAARATAQAEHETFRLSVVEHRQRQTTENRKLCEVAMAKLVRIERDRVTRNAGTQPKLKAWAEAFYLPHAHEDTAVEAMLPLMRKHLVFIESEQDPDAYTRAIVVPHLRAAKAQILAIAEGDPEEFQASLERLLTRWEHDRPAAIADAILQEEVTYVRTL